MQPETTWHALLALVFDANGYPQGPRPVDVEFDATGPCRLRYGGRVYGFTGKTGTNLATGTLSREMSTRAGGSLAAILDREFAGKDRDHVVTWESNPELLVAFAAHAAAVLDEQIDRRLWVCLDGTLIWED